MPNNWLVNSCYHKLIVTFAAGDYFVGECVDTHPDGRLWLLIDGAPVEFFYDEIFATIVD